MKKGISGEDGQIEGQPATKRAGKTALSKDIQTHIGKKLRTVYGQLVEEPVPDKFADLLNRLADSEEPRTEAAMSNGGLGEARREPQS